MALRQYSPNMVVLPLVSHFEHMHVGQMDARSMLLCILLQTRPPATAVTLLLKFNGNIRTLSKRIRQLILHIKLPLYKKCTHC